VRIITATSSVEVVTGELQRLNNCSMGPTIQEFWQMVIAEVNSPGKIRSPICYFWLSYLTFQNSRFLSVLE
jgi:hypothetical protein